jgi:hypothetical protein
MLRWSDACMHALFQILLTDRELQEPYRMLQHLLRFQKIDSNAF